jgi:two-component system response regulator AtoC
VNSGLKRLVDEDKFRKDLFYRLNVFELCIPPLRERVDDIPVLAAFFLDMFAKDFGKQVHYISDDVMSAFRAYKFSGNVRELKHIVDRAVILADGDTVKRKHLPERFQQAPAEAGEAPAEDTPEKLVSLAEMEAKYILRVLEACGGNKTRTAEVLGISRAALWRKLRHINEDRE